MVLRDTDADWQRIAASDTYFKVFSQDRYKGDALDESARREFFASGQTHIDWVLDRIHNHLDAKFAPRSALDFGCGVGRLVLPLSGICDRVVGVDVAEPMLREAHANLAAADIRNVELVKADDRLSRVDGKFDLIHSHIVFQHIPPLRGRRIIRHLLEHLTDEGFGVLHVLYSKARFGPQLEKLWPDDGIRNHGWRAWQELRRALRTARRRLMGRKPRAELNPYTLNPILHELQEAGVRRLHLELTDHTGSYGTVLFFQRASDRSYRV